MDPIPHPELEEHGSFEHLPLGRLPVRHDERTLSIEKYVDLAVLPELPDSADYSSGIGLWPMYGNDKLGDCTAAAAGHMVTAWTHAIGAEHTIDDSDVEELYWRTGNPSSDIGEPGGETDTGRVELDVLNYWRHTGIGADKIGAYAGVAPGEVEHVKATVWLFGGAYIGVALPLTAQHQQVWDVDGNPDDDHTPAYRGSWGGHAVNVVAYDPEGVTVVTWGALQKMTWAFWHAYVDEAYAVLSPDFFKDGVSLEGFDVATLQADLAAVTGGSLPHDDGDVSHLDADEATAVSADAVDIADLADQALTPEQIDETMAQFAVDNPDADESSVAITREILEQGGGLILDMDGKIIGAHLLPLHEGRHLELDTDEVDELTRHAREPRERRPRLRDRRSAGRLGP